MNESLRDNGNIHSQSVTSNDRDNNDGSAKGKRSSPSFIVIDSDK